MKKIKLIYVFDAYCSWCYGFGPVVERIIENFSDTMEAEVISGGMIQEDIPLRQMADRFPDPEAVFGRITQMTGQTIAPEYIHMLREPGDTEYTFNSIFPARALATLKYFAPDRDIEQANSLQDLIFKKKADLTKTNSYKPIAEKFGIEWPAFVHRLESEKSLEDARYNFHLARQLEVTSYPAVLIQTGDQYFYLIARGYTSYDDMEKRIHNVLQEEKTRKKPEV